MQQDRKHPQIQPKDWQPGILNFEPIPQEYSKLPSVNSQSIFEKFKSELFKIIEEVSGLENIKLDYSPKGIESYTAELQKLGLSVLEPFALNNNDAFLSDNLSKVNLVAIIPIVVSDKLTVPYAVPFYSDDNINSEIADKVNSKAKETFGISANEIITDKIKELDAKRISRRTLLKKTVRFAQGAGAASVIGTGVYYGYKPCYDLYNHYHTKAIAEKIVDMEKTYHFLVKDNTNLSQTLKPVTANHYAAVIESFGMENGILQQYGVNLSESSRMNIFSLIAQYDLISNRWIPHNKDYSYEFLKNSTVKAIISAYDRASQDIGGDTLFFLANKGNILKTNNNIFASIDKYFTQSIRKSHETLAKEAALAVEYASTNTPKHSLQNIKAANYIALAASFRPEANSVSLGDNFLDTTERVQIFKRLVEIEMSSERYIPDCKDRKANFLTEQLISAIALITDPENRHTLARLINDINN